MDSSKCPGGFGLIDGGFWVCAASAGTRTGTDKDGYEYGYKDGRKDGYGYTNAGQGFRA